MPSGNFHFSAAQYLKFFNAAAIKVTASIYKK